MVKKAHVTSGPKAVTLGFKNRKDFYRHYYHDGRNCGMFLKDLTGFLVGSELVVDILFDEEGQLFRVQGRVAWLRDRKGPQSPAGTGFEFNTNDTSSIKRLLDFAEGREVQFVQRAHDRHPARMDVRYWHESAFISHYTDDISRGGTFVKCIELLPLGTELPIQLKFPGTAETIQLDSVVVWHRTFEPNRGMGVQFVFTGPDQQEQLSRWLATALASVKKNFGNTAAPDSAATNRKP